MNLIASRSRALFLTLMHTASALDLALALAFAAALTEAVVVICAVAWDLNLSARHSILL